MRESEMIISMRPIGYINSPYKTVESIPSQGKIQDNKPMELVFLDKYLEGGRDLKVGERVIILFYFNKSLKEPLIVRSRKYNKIMGVFSTRSPNRPNGIGMTVVEIVSKDEKSISYIGGDMLDGTPVLDIKPA